jgi:hypothetical protein
VKSKEGRKEILTQLLQKSFQTMRYDNSGSKLLKTFYVHRLNLAICTHINIAFIINVNNWTSDKRSPLLILDLGHF